MSGRHPNRVWFALAAAILAFGAVRAACVRFPAAPATPVAVGLREQLASLAPFDDAALARSALARERLAALDETRTASIRAALSAEWKVVPASSRVSGDLTLLKVSLRRAGSDYSTLLRSIRSVQDTTGISLTGISLTAQRDQLVAELTVTMLTHTQPENANSSGVLAIVPNEEKR